MKDIKITYEENGQRITPYITISDTIAGTFEEGYCGGGLGLGYFGIHCEEKDVAAKTQKIIQDRIVACREKELRYRAESDKYKGLLDSIK